MWSMKLTTYFQLVPWLTVYEAVHPVSYVFVVWCLIILYISIIFLNIFIMCGTLRRESEQDLIGNEQPLILSLSCSLRLKFSVLYLGRCMILWKGETEFHTDGCVVLLYISSCTMPEFPVHGCCDLLMYILCCSMPEFSADGCFDLLMYICCTVPEFPTGGCCVLLTVHSFLHYARISCWWLLWPVNVHSLLHCTIYKNIN